MTNLFGEEDVASTDDEVVENLYEEDSRPPTLSYALDIVGYDDIETQLVQLFNSGRMPHALIFAGEKGRGKYSFALRLARALLSSQKSAPYDDLSVDVTDPVLSRIEQESHPDLKTIRRLNKEGKNELAGEIIIKSVREASHFFSFKPLESAHRMVIVDEADTLNIEAQNAFLKTLEEPPEGALLILIANRPAQLLPTIRSRAQVINFNALSDDVLRSQADMSGIDPEIQAMIIGLSRGGVGAMKQLLDDDVVEALIKINNLMISRDMNDVQRFSESWSTATPGNLDPMVLLDDVMHHNLYQLLLHNTKNDKILYAIDSLRELFDVARSRYLDKRQVIREAFMIYFMGC